MRKLLNKPWVVALLACAAVLLVAQSVLQRPVPRGRPAALALPLADEGMAESTTDVPAADASLAEVLRSIMLPEQIADPFAPRRATRAADSGVTKEKSPDAVDSVRLTAIWRQDDAILVVLNGRICQAGDVVGRIRVDAVEPDGVWIRHWKGRDFIRVGQEFTLVTPAAPAANPRTATHEG